MAVSQEFQAALDNIEIRLVRIMLKNSLMADPTFTEFSEMLKLAEESLNSLYDEHDGEVLINDNSQWNKDYMDTQMVNVIRNFSRERIELLKNICAHLYGTEPKARPMVNSMQKEKSGLRIGPKQGRYESSTADRKRKDGKRMLIGGVVLIGLGIKKEVPLLTVAGVLVVVGGSLMIVKNR